MTNRELDLDFDLAKTAFSQLFGVLWKQPHSDIRPRKIKIGKDDSVGFLIRDASVFYCRVFRIKFEPSKSFKSVNSPVVRCLAGQGFFFVCVQCLQILNIINMFT